MDEKLLETVLVGIAVVGFSFLLFRYYWLLVGLMATVFVVTLGVTVLVTTMIGSVWFGVSVPFFIADVEVGALQDKIKDGGFVLLSFICMMLWGLIGYIVLLAVKFSRIVRKTGPLLRPWNAPWPSPRN